MLLGQSFVHHRQLQAQEKIMEKQTQPILVVPTKANLRGGAALKGHCRNAEAYVVQPGLSICSNDTGSFDPWLVTSEGPGSIRLWPPYLCNSPFLFSRPGAPGITSQRPHEGRRARWFLWGQQLNHTCYMNIYRTGVRGPEPWEW